MSKALLVVYVQNDFCDGGSLEVKNSLKIIPVINGLIDDFYKNSFLVVATKDWHPKDHGSFASVSGGQIGEVGILNGIPQVWWPDHCVQDTWGSELHPGLRNIDNIILKGIDPGVDSYSGFFSASKQATGLDSFLKKHYIDTLYVVGLATDYCVKFTVLDALSLGYKVFLVKDACQGVNLSPEDSRFAVEEMVNKGALVVESSDISL